MDVLIGWPGGDWQSTARISGLIAGSYLTLIWITTVLWAYRDVRLRTRDPLSQLVGVAMVTALPLVGIPLYLVLRPTGTLQEAYDRQLEQEAILSDLHSISACPNCRRPVQDEFMVCPFCRTGLKEPCSECGRLMTHAWRHCPFCGTTRERHRSASRLEFDGAEAEPTAQQSDRESTSAPAQRPAATRRAGEAPPVPARPRTGGEPATQ